MHLFIIQKFNYCMLIRGAFHLAIHWALTQKIWGEKDFHLAGHWARATGT